MYNMRTRSRVQYCKVWNNSVTTSASLYAHVTNKNPVILPKSILGIISIISSRAREVSGRFVTEGLIDIVCTGGVGKATQYD
jgi:hypothetical protein